MTPHEWQRIKQIVGDALEQPDTKSRLDFLSAACNGDRALQAEIDALLAQASDRLEAAVNDMAAVMGNEGAVGIGERLGDYELIRQIGHGGMGTIYLARRADEEFEKEVAIKILKRGTDTEEVLRRFRAERQILAQLEHPNIAHLIDAGTSPEGLPYFVMEYVDGIPITDYCTASKLSVRERVELFIKVSAALHFAHQNLVVHRDLKPGNILITANSESLRERGGEPKLLDFGIAKLLSPGGDFLLTTIQNQQRFTPAYASPEQIRGDPVTTASDVYSLGALLYELLVGTPPHRFSSAHPSPTELFRVIVEQEPLRASVAVVQNRNSKFEIRKSLTGDLDNILHKALRKEPEQRYLNVTAFADDLRRFLEGRPVRARPATFGYRVSKFISRNKLGVTAAALLLATLLGGIAATTWQARKARREQAVAQRRFADVRKLANLFIFKYQDGIAVLPGSTELRKQLVRDALAYLNSLAQEGIEDDSLRREIANAYKRIGDVQGGVLTSLITGATTSISNLGDSSGALESYRKALAIRERLASRPIANKEPQLELAEIHGNLGQVLFNLGKSAEAAEEFQKQIKVLEKLLSEDESNKGILAELRSSYGALSLPLLDLGGVDAALDALRRCVVLGEQLVAEDPTNAAYLQALGVGYGDTGRLLFREARFSEALQYYQRALPLGERLTKENPSNPLFRRELGMQHRNVGGALLQTGNKIEALEHLRKSIALFEQLMKDDPNDMRTRRSAAYVYRALGEAFAANGDRAEAEKNFDTALNIFETQAAKDPKSAALLVQQSITHLTMSRFFAVVDLRRAIASAERAVRISEPLVAATPRDVATKKTLAESHAQLGTYHASSAPSQNPTTREPREAWLRAKHHFQKSADLWRDLSENGKLNREDAGKRDHVQKEITRCDETLALAKQ